MAKKKGCGKPQPFCMGACHGSGVPPRALACLSWFVKSEDQDQRHPSSLLPCAARKGGGKGGATLPFRSELAWTLVAFRKQKKAAVSRSLLQSCGGAEGDRTPDLHDANVALSQLSYRPRCGWKSNAMDACGASPGRLGKLLFRLSGIWTRNKGGPCLTRWSIVSACAGCRCAFANGRLGTRRSSPPAAMSTRTDNPSGFQ